jgi:uncharacterized membrane protein YuzA (DUF378 family)
MQQRSTFVTVVGWIFIVLSGLAALQFLMILFTPMDKLLADAQRQAELMQPAGAPQAGAAFMASMLHGVFVFMFCVSAWVLLSGIGLVMRKAWARISFIVILGVGVFFNLIYVLIGLAGRGMSMGEVPGANPAMAGMMHSVMGAMAVMGAVLAVLFAFVIYKLTREKIKQEFSGSPKP